MLNNCFSGRVFHERETLRLESAFFCMVGVVVLAGLLGAFLSWFLTGPIDKTLSRLFIERFASFARPEPHERAGYLLAIATVPIVAYVLINRGVPERMRGPGPILTTLLIATVLASSDLAHGVLVGFPLNTPFNWLKLVLLLLASSVIAYIAVKQSLSQRSVWMIIAWALAISAIVLGELAFRVISATEIYGEIHFEAIFYSITQIAAGKTVLVDLPAQYGLYAELLRPLFGWIELSVERFTVLLAVLQSITCLLLLYTSALLIRSNAIKVLCAFTLVWIIGSTWVNIHISSVQYYSSWPIRTLFPAISFCLFVIARHNGMAIRHVAVLSITAGFAMIWNLDSGIPIFGALVAFLGLDLLSSERAHKTRNAMRLAIGILTPPVIFAAFICALAASAEGSINLGYLVKYQRIFYQTGFGMLPLPKWPHPWMIVFGLYLYAFVGGALRCRRRGSIAWDTMFFLSVLGFGLFTYFQGRSHFVVLSFVCWPAIIIAFILADRTLRAVSARALPKIWTWTAAPVLVVGATCLLHTLMGFPKIVDVALRTARQISSPEVSSTTRAVAFIKATLEGSTDIAILDKGQAVYFVGVGLASSVQGPGIVEAVLIEDRERFIDALLIKPVSHLFIGLDDDRSIPVHYRRLLETYQLGQVGPNRLQHLEPKN